MEAGEVIRKAMSAFAPPPDITGSGWADKYRHVVGGPMPGRWSTDNTPDLRYPMDCITDPSIRGIVMVKPTRTGGTDGVINTAIGYHMHHEPCKILYAQSTKDQGELYSDTILMPMVYNTPVLAGLIKDETGRKATQTKTKKSFPGGSLRIIGAKSPRGFQALEARIAIGDDLDEWETHKAGDPVKKLIDRTKGIWNSKVILVSYPTTEGLSRIDDYFKRTNQLYRYVPCPRCGEFQVLKFGGRDTKFGLKWGKTGEIWYECEYCHGKIVESEKHAMNLAGEWRPHGISKIEGWIGVKLNPFVRKWHDWTGIRDDFLQCGHDPLKLRVFTNQTLGDVYKPQKIDVDYKKLHERREEYPVEVPQGGLIITVGADVQHDRIEAEAIAYGRDFESWAIEKKVFYGNPAEDDVWNDLDTFLTKTWKHESGLSMGAARAFIDSGDGNLHQKVYDFCTPREVRGVYACKGDSRKGQAVFAKWSTVNNKKTKLAFVGTDSAKGLIYPWMMLKIDGPGYMHFPLSLDLDHFKQLTSEYEDEGKWHQKPNRPNEGLDITVYSLSAMFSLNPDWDELERNIGADNFTYRVFSMYDPAKHRPDIIEVKPQKKLVLCVDFNIDPCVWLLAQTDGKAVEILDEFVMRGADVVRMGKEVRKRYPDNFKDAKRFIVYGPDDDKSSWALLSELDLRAHRMNRRADLKSGVNAICNMLEGIKGEVRLTIHPRCTMLRKDLEMCLWKEDSTDLDRASGRGSAINALSNFIAQEFPLRAARPNPQKRFYK